jgi:hypothetical protein
MTTPRISKSKEKFMESRIVPSEIRNVWFHEDSWLGDLDMPSFELCPGLIFKNESGEGAKPPCPSHLFANYKFTRLFLILVF